MKTFFPQSLTARTIIVLIVGLSISHLISMLIYSGDRVEALTLLGGKNMAQRVANVAHLVDETPSNWRRRIVKGVSEPGFQVRVTSESLLLPQSDPVWHVRAARSFLEQSLSNRQPSDIRLQVFDLEKDGDLTPHSEPGSWMQSHMMRMVYGMPVHQALRASVRLDDGRWLNFVSDIPQSTPLWSSRSILSMAAMAIAVILLSVWVVKRLSAPLRTFAHAARRLGRDVNAPPLTVTGPQEVRDAAIAFNEMQGRLTRLIDNRTRMMAAISHDLRTPITLLRLRAESLEESEDRSKMLATLADMESMIAATLEFARKEAKEEDRRKVDIGALVGTICDDMSDAGYPVTFESPKERVALECQHLALKRAITNLTENAVKYGETAIISLHSAPNGILIRIADTGPGIEEDELDLVFQPFYRCDQSRSAGGGGVGLGLSLARSIARNHGGDLKLRNGTKRGLIAEMTLPV